MSYYYVVIKDFLCHLDPVLLDIFTAIIVAIQIALTCVNKCYLSAISFILTESSLYSV
uniref:Uncharacterized protein n=1 Tax=Rhizophora mucronata TaxID=61149 RepID=A0A2P2NFW8_RHIMU